jgi:hypothetical protein
MRRRLRDFFAVERGMLLVLFPRAMSDILPIRRAKLVSPRSGRDERPIDYRMKYPVMSMMYSVVTLESSGPR